MSGNKIIWVQIIILLLLSSCIKTLEKQRKQVTCTELSDYNEWYAWTKGPLCKSDTCSTYQAIWKELLIKRNSLTSDFFNKHIIPCSSGVGSWNEWVSFSICYKIVIDWAVVYRCDHFIIKISKDNVMFSNLQLPTDILLSKDQIEKALDHNAFGSTMTNVSNDASLLFNSKESAMRKLIGDSNLSTLCFQDIVLNESGHMMVEAFAEYSFKENSCAEGHLDLMTGETTITDVPCYYTTK